MTDAFGKDADRISLRERGIDRRERLRVLRNIDSLIQLAIDRNRAGPRNQETEGTVEERRLRQEPHVPFRRRPNDSRIEQSIRMIWQQQRCAGLRWPADTIDPIKEPAGGTREEADEGGGRHSMRLSRYPLPKQRIDDDVAPVLASEDIFTDERCE